MEQSVFERVGGFATVRKVVSAFYDKVLESPRLADHFAGADMPRLIDHQTKFVAQVMHGPAAYTDEQLQRVHRHMAISHGDFMEAADLLAEAMEDAGLADDVVANVRDELFRREPFIVTRQNA